MGNSVQLAQTTKEEEEERRRGISVQKSGQKPVVFAVEPLPFFPPRHLKRLLQAVDA
jgi:hypothetical protein